MKRALELLKSPKKAKKVKIEAGTPDKLQNKIQEMPTVLWHEPKGISMDEVYEAACKEDANERERFVKIGPAIQLLMTKYPNTLEGFIDALILNNDVDDILVYDYLIRKYTDRVIVADMRKAVDAGNISVLTKIKNFLQENDDSTLIDTFEVMCKRPAVNSGKNDFSARLSLIQEEIKQDAQDKKAQHTGKAPQSSGGLAILRATIAYNQNQRALEASSFFPKKEKTDNVIMDDAESAAALGK